MKIERGMPRLVKPSKDTTGLKNAVPRFVVLSSSDLVVPTVHVEVVYAFSECPESCSSKLEEALARVLGEYREFAGRLGKDEETGRPAIELSDEGAVFVEAEGNGALQDVFPFEPSSLLLDMVPPNRGAPELLLVQVLILSKHIAHEDCSLVALSTLRSCGFKVTKYKCGGMTMGIARHHQVADGEAASHFMQAWASALKGSPVPSVLHDRSMLIPKETSKPSFDHSEYKKPPPKPDTGDTSTNPPLVRKKLHFDVETLRKIKTSTVRAGDGCHTYTTFESLTGHLWRCVTQARGLAGDIETRSLVAANGRRRLDPPVPEDFFGNVIFHACPQTKVGQLLEEPPWYAADLVHTAIRRLDNEYMRSAMDFVEEQRTNPAPVARSRTSVLSPNVSITSWVQLPLYKLDFGWGTPVFAGPPFIPFEGLVILAPSYTQDGSIDVLIGLFEPHMAKFQEICYEISPRGE